MKELKGIMAYEFFEDLKIRVFDSYLWIMNDGLRVYWSF